MAAFGRALPKLRARVDADLARPGLPREKVLAAAVRLLEITLIRVGNDEYAKANKSFGLTTLRKRHVTLNGAGAVFEFRGKSGKEHRTGFHDRRLARVLRRCEELPGQRLFQYVDEAGERRHVESQDVNAYIREAMGEDFSAKDFRTWAATLAAARALCMESAADGHAADQADHHHLREGGRRAARQHPRRLPRLLHPPVRVRGLRGRPALARPRGRSRQGRARAAEAARPAGSSRESRLTQRPPRRRALTAGHPGGARGFRVRVRPNSRLNRDGRSMLPARLRFGAFIAPFHPLDENPTLAIQRDLELVQLLDELGYDEAWIGEHHSAAYELIASPEVFIAAAAERTKHIRLGTGVSSLPYHHPFMLADRINQLDHMTRGRVMFGVGPGALSSDAYMMGIPIARQRDMMDEALDVLVRLLRGEEVSHDSDWFKLNRARLQMTPLFAAQRRDRGGEPGLADRRAGRGPPRPRPALDRRHLRRRLQRARLQLGDRRGAGQGQRHDRRPRRLAAGRARCTSPRPRSRRWPTSASGWRSGSTISARSPTCRWRPTSRRRSGGGLPVDAGMAVVGTPDEAAAKIQALVDQSGGFGAFLFMAHNWAPWAQTKRSYELFARYVAPKFQSLNVGREASMAWVKDNKAEFTAQSMAAVGARIAQHAQEKGADNINPMIAAMMGLKKTEEAAE